MRTHWQALRVALHADRATQVLSGGGGYHEIASGHVDDEHVGPVQCHDFRRGRHGRLGPADDLRLNPGRVGDGTMPRLYADDLPGVSDADQDTAAFAVGQADYGIDNALNVVGLLELYLQGLTVADQGSKFTFLHAPCSTGN